MRPLTNPEVEPHPFAEDNIVFLQQGLELLADLSDEEYVRQFPPSFVSPIGAHLRHIVDHYDCFLKGIVTGRIDYDDRARDVRMESEQSVATHALQNTIASLRSLAREDQHRELAVRTDCGGGPTEAGMWARSSIDRELQFLVSHTVHHFALVAVILRLEGRQPIKEFGVSPSAIKYRQNL